jgi:hypothetical protein
MERSSPIRVPMESAKKRWSDMDHLRVARPANCEACAIELVSRGVEARQAVTLAGTVGMNDEVLSAR